MSLEELHAEYLDQPHEVSLETLSLCNAACSFCPYPTIERKGNKMSDALIDLIIGEMTTFDRPFFFSPFKLNEPLLDNRLFNILHRVERDTIARSRVFTNGAPLTQRKIDQLAAVGNIYHLWVSLNSHIKEEYEALMQIPFDRTVERLDNLHNQDFPHAVMLSTVGHPNEDFRRYCFDRWPKFESVAIQRSEWLGYTYSQVDSVPDTPCERWFELSIQSTGEVAHCCMHDGTDKRYNIGDITKQTLLEVYNAPFWRERREKLLSRWDLDDKSPCAKCTY